MTKLLTYLALFCFVTTIIADDCNNPLLEVFGFTSLGTPTSVTGLKYCKSLQNSLSCCSADTINSFQDKAQALGKKLSDIVAARDKALVETRDQIIPALQDNINRMKENVPKAFNKIMEAMGGAGNMSQGQMPFSADGANAMATVLQNMTSQITGNLSAVKGAFRDFQKQRSPCVIELIKLQSSAWCLACDPAWATNGVNGDNVTLSNRVCQRMQSSCFKFIMESASQSAVLAMKNIGPIIGQMATVFSNIATMGMQGISGLTDMEGSIVNNTPVYNASNSTMRPVEMPPGCTEGNCNWICDSMFVNGVIDPNAITAGGIQSNATDSFFGSSGESQGDSRLLAQDEDVVRRKLLNKRRLTTNEWNPDSDEAGVTVTFSDDPAGVGSSSGLLIKTGMAALLAMLAAFAF